MNDISKNVSHKSNKTDKLNKLTNSNHADNCLEQNYSESYFDGLYRDNTDPWHYQTRWYEKRKRDMCLAVLPQSHYQNAIELGCGNGVFSELLAARCQALLSIDGNSKAVRLAQTRLADSAHVRVIQGVIPNSLSTMTQALNPLDEGHHEHNANSDNGSIEDNRYDLIVISEILYYLTAEDIDRVINWIQHNLAKGGTLLCCHWRYPIDGFVMTGETVHQRLKQAFGIQSEKDTFNPQTQLIDSDFLLDIWQRSPSTVAMQENLV